VSLSLEPVEGTPENARLPAPLPARRAYRPEGRAYSLERRTVIFAVRPRRIREISGLAIEHKKYTLAEPFIPA